MARCESGELQTVSALKSITMKAATAALVLVSVASPVWAQGVSRKDASKGRRRGKRPATGAGQSRGTVAAPLQGPASRSAAESSRKRSPVPQPSAGPATDIEGTAAAVQQPPAAAARPHPATHGNLGAPDSRPEAAGAAAFFATQRSASRSSPKTADRDPRPQRHASGPAATGHRVRPLQKRVLALRSAAC